LIQSLNTLRALAAFIVVITHYSKSTGLFNGFVGRGSGQMGVMLFFMISGFLMAYLYLEENKPFAWLNVKNYLISRASRVLPLYLILVLCSFISKQINDSVVLYNIPDTSSLLSHLLLLNGVSVFWTIPPEIHFYIFFIILWLFYSTKKVMMLLVLITSFIFASYLGFPRYSGNLGALHYDFFFLRSLPYFLTGVLLGLLYRRFQFSKDIQNGAYLITLIILPLLFPDVFEFIFGYRHGLWQDIHVLVMITIVFVCFVFLTPKNHWFVSNPIGNFLGKISYSVYLLHMPVLKHFKELGKNNPELYLFFFIICTILIAYLSYLFIEKPSRDFLNKKYKKSKNN